MRTFTRLSCISFYVALGVSVEVNNYKKPQTAKSTRDWVQIKEQGKWNWALNGRLPSTSQSPAGKQEEADQSYPFWFVVCSLCSIPYAHPLFHLLTSKKTVLGLLTEKDMWCFLVGGDSLGSRNPLPRGQEKRAGCVHAGWKIAFQVIKRSKSRP